MPLDGHVTTPSRLPPTYTRARRPVSRPPCAAGRELRAGRLPPTSARAASSQVEVGMAVTRLAFPLFILLAAAGVAAATRSPSAFVQNAIYSNRITIFSKTYCP